MGQLVNCEQFVNHPPCHILNHCHSISKKVFNGGMVLYKKADRHLIAFNGTSVNYFIWRKLLRHLTHFMSGETPKIE